MRHYAPADACPRMFMSEEEGEEFTSPARIVSNLVKNISTKCLSCLNSLKQTCRQLYDPSGQRRS